MPPNRKEYVRAHVYCIYTSVGCTCVCRKVVGRFDYIIIIVRKNRVFFHCALIRVRILAQQSIGLYNWIENKPKNMMTKKKRTTKKLIIMCCVHVNRFISGHLHYVRRIRWVTTVTPVNIRASYTTIYVAWVVVNILLKNWNQWSDAVILPLCTTFDPRQLSHHSFASRTPLFTMNALHT